MQANQHNVSEGSRVSKGVRGVTVVEMLIAVIVISIMSAVAVKPVVGLLQRIKLQNTADGIKYYVLNARMRALSNTFRHCGVVLRVHASTTIDDTVFAFFDKNPADNTYTAGEDSLYGNPFVIEKKYKLVAAIPATMPQTIAFRGDGSANLSMALVLTLNNFQDTVKVLASTGKVKVVSK